MKTPDSKAWNFPRFKTVIMNRMVPSSAQEQDSLTYWRVRILFALIFSGLVISMIAFVPVIIMVIKEKFWSLLIFDVSAWLIGIGLLLIRSLRYNMRAGITLLMLYLVGLALITSVGPLSGGPAWLFAFPVMVGVLLGSRAAVMALLLNALTLTIIGWGLSAGLFGQDFPFFSSMERMIVAGANFMLLNTIAALSVAVLVKGLISVHQKEKDLVGILKRERERLTEIMNGLGSEVEERKLTEKALRESENRLNIIFESAPDAYYINDNEGIFIVGNRAAEEMLGYTREELIGKSLVDVGIIPMDEVEKAVKIFAANTNGKSTGPDEFILKRRDGTKVNVEILTHPVKINGEDRVLGIARDITGRRRTEKERRLMEARLRQAKKMEAIGTLAGGIAHQFNNALSVITGHIDLLEIYLPGDEKIADYAGKMKTSTHRMTRLTSQLLAYARGGKYQAKTISLHDFLKITIPLVQHAVGSAIHVDTDLPRDIPNIEVDLTQMQMVLSAVLTNASEAMEGKGCLRVACRKVAITDDTVTDFIGLKPGDYACLTVTDTGKGMDEETKNKIFDPFFTTGVEGRGLGMAAAHGIVKNHNGGISVDSEPGRGTAVSIYLPAAIDSIQARRAGSLAAGIPVKEEVKPKSKPEWIKGTDTILIIEDEKSVMEVSRLILERLGYHVLEAETGQKAIEVVKSFEGHIDLAMLDILMPDMSGNEVYPLLIKARPDLKVLVCSGYSIDGPVRKILDAGAEGFIQKPFRIEVLSEKLKTVLAK